MAANYFKRFGLLKYKFGDNTTTTVFQNLSQYVDLFDQVRTSDVLFEDATILSGERPDQLSFRLYGTVDYYWTFFLVNEKLRTMGWPLRQQEVIDYAKKFYPHRTIRMKLNQGDIIDYYNTKIVDGEEVQVPVYRTKLIGTAPDNFPVGTQITGTSSGTFGDIIRRDLSMGAFVVDTGEAYGERTSTTILTVNSNGIAEFDVLQSYDILVRPTIWVLTKDDVVVSPSTYTIEIDRLSKSAKLRNIPFTNGSVYKLTFSYWRRNNGDGKFTAGEEVTYPNPAGGSTSGVIFSETAQYNSVHHYEDADGNWTDIDPFTQNTSGLTPVTYLERLEQENLNLKQIKYIKPESIENVVKEFQRLMNG
jgi:hypothetical protein